MRLSERQPEQQKQQQRRQCTASSTDARASQYPCAWSEPPVRASERQARRCRRCVRASVRASPPCGSLALTLAELAQRIVGRSLQPDECTLTRPRQPHIGKRIHWRLCA